MKSKNFIIISLIVILANLPLSYFHFLYSNKCCDDDAFIPYLEVYVIATSIIVLVAFIFGFVLSLFIKDQAPYKQRAVDNSLFILIFFQALFLAVMLYKTVKFLC
ncbi:MAG: hypothetical protein DI539_03330 [Flavobacterium psychrophilum]|nr:MAG: hypothetical protein DI539_03330 [Flavobacterium psychrophilum]